MAEQAGITVKSGKFVEASEMVWPVFDPANHFAGAFGGSRANLERNLIDGLPGALKGLPTMGEGFTLFDGAASHVQLPAISFTKGTMFAAFRVHAMGTPATRFAISAASGGFGPGLYVNASNVLTGNSYRTISGSPNNDPCAISAPIADETWYFASFVVDETSQELRNHTLNTFQAETGSQPLVATVNPFRVGADMTNTGSRPIDIAFAAITPTVYDLAARDAVYQRIKGMLSMDGLVV